MESIGYTNTNENRSNGNINGPTCDLKDNNKDYSTNLDSNSNGRANGHANGTSSLQDGP
jgi:hypothetical protein